MQSDTYVRLNTTEVPKDQEEDQREKGLPFEKDRSSKEQINNK